LLFERHLHLIAALALSGGKLRRTFARSGPNASMHVSMYGRQLTDSYRNVGGRRFLKIVADQSGVQPAYSRDRHAAISRIRDLADAGDLFTRPVDGAKRNSETKEI
jgi:hypothetical protein